ncbi:MAG: type II secretion system F family protein, partial [Bradymonadaceae bacterium]
MDQQGRGDEPVVRESRTYMTDPQAETLCQVFSEGLRSGVGYARIFEMLERNGLEAQTIDRMREAVLDRGDKLGEAFARHGILDPTARKLVLVAERQGTLPETFDHLGKSYGLRHDRKREFVFSMVEPMILVTLGGIVTGNVLAADIIA